MKQFLTILSFELRHYLKNKVFVGITLFLVLVSAVAMFFPRVKEAIAIGSDGESSSGEKSVMIVNAADEASAEAARELFSAAFTDYEIKASSEDTQTVKEHIISGEAECAFVLNDGGYTYYVNDLSLNDSNTYIADELLLQLFRTQAMIAGGIEPQQAADIMSMQVHGEVEALGKNQENNFFYTYIMIMALYIFIMMYGNMVATSVATEKSSRAMELLITSADPTALMFGKVLAASIAGLLQMGALFGSALLFYSLNRSYWQESSFVASLFDIPPAVLVYLLVFFILGFLIYAFMYGAIGSMVSKLEDVSSSIGPVSILFMAGFFVIIFSMAFGSIDSPLMKVCSYIPFTASMAMFTRITMSTVPGYAIAISILLQVITVIGTGFLGAKIYRVGVLLYGTKPKLGEVFKAISKA